MASEALVKNHFILPYVTSLGLYVDYQLCLGISQWLYYRSWCRVGPAGLLALKDRFKVTGAEQAVTHTELKGYLCLLLPAFLCRSQNRCKLVPNIAGIKRIDLIYKYIYLTGVTKELPYSATETIKLNGRVPAVIGIYYVITNPLRDQMCGDYTATGIFYY